MPGYLHIAKELGMGIVPPKPPASRVDYGAEADRLQWESFEDKYGKRFMAELEFIGAIMKDDVFAAIYAADRYGYSAYEITSGGLDPYFWRAGEITLFGKSMRPYFEMRDRDAVRHTD